MSKTTVVFPPVTWWLYVVWFGSYMSITTVVFNPGCLVAI